MIQTLDVLDQLAERRQADRRDADSNFRIWAALAIFTTFIVAFYAGQYTAAMEAKQIQTRNAQTN